MKITPKQYAQGLYDLLGDQKQPEIKKIIVNFVEFLAQKRDLNKIKDIILELEKIFQDNQGEKEVTIISARPLNSATKKYLKEYLIKKSQSNSIIIKEKIDSKIIGGFIARYEDKVIDGSLQYNLSLFRKQLSN